MVQSPVRAGADDDRRRGDAACHDRHALGLHLPHGQRGDPPAVRAARRTGRQPAGEIKKGSCRRVPRIYKTTL